MELRTKIEFHETTNINSMSLGRVLITGYVPTRVLLLQNTDRLHVWSSLIAQPIWSEVIIDGVGFKSCCR